VRSHIGKVLELKIFDNGTCCVVGEAVLGREPPSYIAGENKHMHQDLGMPRRTYRFLIPPLVSSRFHVSVHHSRMSVVNNALTYFAYLVGDHFLAVSRPHTHTVHDRIRYVRAVVFNLILLGDLPRNLELRAYSVVSEPIGCEAPRKAIRNHLAGGAYAVR
jgi:hypothetical protein